MLSRRSSGKRLWADAKKRGVVKDIDPPIRKTVVSLNERGIYTQDSCAGHGGYNYVARGKNKGHITFDRRYVKGKGEKIRQTLKKSGLKNIKRKGNTFVFDRKR